MVGRDWNARILPREVSPASVVAPMGKARRPKRNFVPAVALSRTTTTILFTNRKNLVPAGTTKMKSAKRS